VIISSGENHPYVHYSRHDRLLRDGDFLVVDAGPDLDYYDIDITTSFPANGRFTPRQQEVYEAALAVHEANLKVYRPGLTIEQCRNEVDDILRKQGFDLTRDYFKRMRGDFGHYVGDGDSRRRWSPKVLKPGMVFANEPYMTWPGENLGVRVEDTVLITETGCEKPDGGHTTICPRHRGLYEGPLPSFPIKMTAVTQLEGKRRGAAGGRNGSCFLDFRKPWRQTVAVFDALRARRSDTPPPRGVAARVAGARKPVNSRLSTVYDL